jgi:hypothetical protein
MMMYMQLEVSKKTEKPRKPKKPNHEKKPIKILKKSASSVRFRFYKPKMEKTEPNQQKTEPKLKKTSQTKKTKPNRFEPVFVLKNRTETSRCELVSVFFLKFRFRYFFL